MECVRLFLVHFWKSVDKYPFLEKGRGSKCAEIIQQLSFDEKCSPSLRHPGTLSVLGSSRQTPHYGAARDTRPGGYRVEIETRVAEDYANISQSLITEKGLLLVESAYLRPLNPL